MTGKQKINQDHGKMSYANIIWTDELIGEFIPLVEAIENIWNLSVILVLLALLYYNQFLIHIPPFLLQFLIFHRRIAKHSTHTEKAMYLFTVRFV